MLGGNGPARSDVLKPAFFGVLAGLLCVCAAGYSGPKCAWSQDQKSDFDLTWRIQHNQAAAYEVFDGQKGSHLPGFRLLGCEVEGTLGANGYGELPYRFLFKAPKDKVKVGGQWQVKQTVFGDAIGLMSASEIVGLYRVRAIKKVKLEDLFKAGMKGKKSDAVEAAIVDGQFEVARCNWTNGTLGTPEKKPSASFATTAIVRLSDGAIIGGRTILKGRTEEFSRMAGGPVIGKADEIHELILKEPLLEISKKALQEDINQAILRGSKWLKGQSGNDGAMWDKPGYPLGTMQGVGATALAIDALLHSGVPEKDVAVRNGFAYCQGKRLTQSYDYALRLLAIESKYLPADRFLNADGFSEESAREHIGKSISKDDKAAVADLVQPLLECQGKHGSFGYTKGIDEPNLSNTQYALLGIKAAARMGYSVPPDVWKRAFLVVASSAIQSGPQIKLEIGWNGGSSETRTVSPYAWPYYVPAQAQKPGASTLTATMVTAALTSIALCRSELLRTKEWTDALEAQAEQLIWGGLAWIKTNYSVRASKPEGAWWGPAMVYYFLFSLERALVMLEVESIAGHEWYLEGSEVILSWQRNDGAWEGAFNTAVVDTSFALLFLKRAIIPVATGSKRQDPSHEGSAGPGNKEPDTKDK